jgi:hypothetical protein
VSGDVEAVRVSHTRWRSWAASRSLTVAGLTGLALGLEGGGERITSYLVDEATDEQALDLWCRVVIPADGRQLGPDHVRLYKGGKPAPAPSGGRLGSTLVLRDPVCPATTPASQTG